MARRIAEMYVSCHISGVAVCLSKKPQFSLNSEYDIHHLLLRRSTTYACTPPGILVGPIVLFCLPQGMLFHHLLGIKYRTLWQALLRVRVEMAVNRGPRPAAARSRNVIRPVLQSIVMTTTSSAYRRMRRAGEPTTQGIQQSWQSWNTQLTFHDPRD